MIKLRYDNESLLSDDEIKTRGFSTRQEAEAAALFVLEANPGRRVYVTEVRYVARVEPRSPEVVDLAPEARADLRAL